MNFKEYHKIQQGLRARHKQVYVILAPPRTSSTALVRVFWQHPAIGFYNNEPFDRYYHRGETLDSVLKHLAHSAEEIGEHPAGQGLLIKEMTFQADTRSDMLTDVATAPPVFVMRDPRSSIASRMRMVAKGGGDPFFPHNETGWDSLYAQVEARRTEGRSYLLIDASDFRREPVLVLRQLFAHMGLTFEPGQLRWRPAHGLRMGNLQGEQDHFYTRVLESNKLEPPVEQIPRVDEFPIRGGLRAHVRHCMSLYHELQRDPNLVTCPR